MATKRRLHTDFDCVYHIEYRANANKFYTDVAASGFDTAIEIFEQCTGHSAYQIKHITKTDQHVYYGIVA